MRSGLLFLAAFAATVTAPIQAQEAQAIREGRPVSGMLERETPAEYTLDLRAEMFVFGEVDQIDVDVVVTIKDPEGETVGRFDGPARGAEMFQFETESAGTYVIEVAPFEDESGSYQIEVVRSERVATNPRDRVDQLMSQFTGDDVPGAVVGVVMDGELEFARAYGMANLEYDVEFDTETISNIGSVSKQFTAMGLLLLEQEGKLSLDDPITKHIPELPDFGEVITLRHLLNHTSGYREIYNLLPMTGFGGEDTFARERAIQVVQRQPALQNSPGAEWNYNNTGFILLSLTVERVSGQPFNDYMRDAVFAPLGLNDTRMKMVQGEIIPGSAQGYVAAEGGGYRAVRDLPASAGAGGIYTSLSDLTRWMLNYRDMTLGGADAIEQMTTRAILTEGDTTTYGLGLGIAESGGQTMYTHTGGDVAHRTLLTYYPEIDAGIILMSNNGAFPLNIGGTIAEAFFGDAFEDEAEEEAVADASAESPMSVERMEAIAGDWVLQGPGTTLGILLTTESGGLYAQPEGQAKIQLAITSDSTGTFDAAGLAVTFHFEDDGSVVRATFAQGGAEFPLIREGAEVDAPEIDLDDYVGRYYSEELETYYEVKSGEEGLEIHHLDMEPIALSHSSGDQFAGAAFFLATVEFRRAGNGHIEGFTVSNGRTRGVWFRRH